MEPVTLMLFPTITSVFLLTATIYLKSLVCEMPHDDIPDKRLFYLMGENIVFQPNRYLFRNYEKFCRTLFN